MVNIFEFLDHISYTCSIKIFHCSVDPQLKIHHGAICFFGYLECCYKYTYLNVLKCRELTVLR